MLENGKERINTCFKALKISDSRAFDIIFAELIRLELDERKPEDKGVRIRVNTDSQKRITETLCVLINKYRKEKDPYLETENIEVFIGDKISEESEDFRTIDFSEFSYEEEKEKLMQRYTDTILGHVELMEELYKQGLTSDNTELQKQYAPYVNELKTQIDELTSEVVNDEHSIFSIFKQGKIFQKQQEITQLQEKKWALVREYRGKAEKNDREAEKRKETVKRLNSKEDTLLGIKFVFTQRRQRVKRYLDLSGKVHFSMEDVENPGDSSRTPHSDYENELE